MPLGETKARLLELVERPINYTDLKMKLGITDKAILVHISDLKSAGLIQKDVESGKWILTDEGARYLEAALSTSAIEETTNISEITISHALSHLRRVLFDFMNDSIFYPRWIERTDKQRADSFRQKYSDVIHYGMEIWSLVDRLEHNLKSEKQKIQLESDTDYSPGCKISDDADLWMKLIVRDLEEAVKDLEVAGLPRFSAYLRRLVEHMKDAYAKSVSV